MSTARKLAEEATGIFRAADRQNRALSSDERLYVEDLIARAEQHGELENRIKGMPNVPAATPDEERFLSTAFGNPGGGARPGGDPGARFTESPNYKTLFGGSATRGERWSTGLIPVSDTPPAAMFKGTLMEGVAGSGSGLVPVPQVVPGVVQTLFSPLCVEQVLGSAQATGNSVRYIHQGTADNAAAGVTEGSAKPESTLGFDYLDESVCKIATWLPVSEEMLEDAEAIQPFINDQLLLFVNLEAERQLLYGTGSGELQGLLNGRGVPVYTGSTATDGNIAKQLFSAINSMRGSAFLEPEWTLISPQDYETLRLLEDENGAAVRRRAVHRTVRGWRFRVRERAGHRRDRDRVE